jgi:putative heme iron utilization protein
MDTLQAGKARGLLRAATQAVLSTNQATLGAPDSEESGWPFGSLVSIACDPAGAPIMLLSGLAEHSRNLTADPRASLLIGDRNADSSGAEDPLSSPRATLLGRAALDADPALRARFLVRHPYAFYAEFADFRIWRLEIAGVHFVEGFGRVKRFAPADFLLPVSRAWNALETEFLAEIAADAPDLAGRIAHRAGLVGDSWRLTGIDPEGVDLRHRAGVARVPFGDPIFCGAAGSQLDPGIERAALRHALSALGEADSA